MKIKDILNEIQKEMNISVSEDDLKEAIKKHREAVEFMQKEREVQNLPYPEYSTILIEKLKEYLQTINDA